MVVSARPVDWKSTLNLPKTEFPMRADLARREPEWLARWAAGAAIRAHPGGARGATSAPAYVLHDGPPYATGGIHYGTVLNKVLKDIVVRSQLHHGAARPCSVPGWDCHGLPIEQQVEKQLWRQGRQRRWTRWRSAQRCEAHALKFVDIMRTEFKRLGCFGNWDDPYLTLRQGLRGDDRAPAGRRSSRGGCIYRGKKPVHWCLAHRTALAEAEVEYEEHASPSIYVRFPLVGDLGKADPRLRGKRRGVRHLDDDPVDPAREPGRRRQPRARLRRASRATANT